MLRRLTANIFDFLLVLIIIFSIISIIPQSKNAENISKELNTYLEKDLFSLKGEERNQAIDLAYSLDRETTYSYVIIALVMIVYFIFIPKYLKGKTLGKYFRKIKLVNEDISEVNYNTLTYRALLNTGLFIIILLPFFVYICNAFWYFNITLILMALQLLFWLISAIILIIKKKSLVDYLTKTKIIEVKR